MKIVKRDSFRSQGALVNKTDDMERIVIDCTKRESIQLMSWVARQDNAK